MSIAQLSSLDLALTGLVPLKATIAPVSTRVQTFDALRRFLPVEPESTERVEKPVKYEHQPAQNVLDRQEIEQLTQKFLAEGNEIESIPFGHSGEEIRNFTKAELLAHHKNKTRRMRGGR